MVIVHLTAQRGHVANADDEADALGSRAPIKLRVHVKEQLLELERQVGVL